MNVSLTIAGFRQVATLAENVRGSQEFRVAVDRHTVQPRCDEADIDSKVGRELAR